MEPQGEPTHEELLLLLSAKDVTIKSLTGRVEQLAARVAERGRAPEGVVLMPASLGPTVPQRATPVTVTVRLTEAAHKEAVHAG